MNKELIARFIAMRDTDRELCARELAKLHNCSGPNGRKAVMVAVDEYGLDDVVRVENGRAVAKGV